MNRRIQLSLSILGLVFATACITQPFNDQAFSGPSSPISFSGFAFKQGATVQVKALNKSTGQYQVFATATANLAVTPQIGGRTLYYWSVRKALYDPANSSTACFFHSGCYIPSGAANVQVQADEVGTYNGLVTFDAGGTQCVSTKLDNGEDWLAAGWDCKSADSPILNLIFP